MIRAYVLIEILPGACGDVVKKIRGIEGVKSAEAATGPYDVIACVEVPNVKALGNLSFVKIQGIEGVKRTLTCVVTVF